MATSWFNYNGSGSVNDPTSYSAIMTPNCPGDKINLCAISAEIQFIGGVQRPIITPALQTEISTALTNKAESANVRLKP